ncbi:MAG: CRISPR-associated helicase Cas3' [Thermoprotei archaeon]|nr:MAG: CRISPR-associated helicase Cas3' [Thermoprotei archaeon]
MARILNELFIDTVEKIVKSGEVPIIIYEAPTGYGKTTSSISFYSVTSRYGIASSLIHVLPMRSIAIELYCKIANALGGGEAASKYCEEFGRDAAIERALADLDISLADVGYQFMDPIDSSKSPFFLKTLLITTFNSFFHNLARVPVGEFRKYRRHYEVPRAAIFTSSMVLDEAHLYGGDPGGGSETSVITAFIVSVKALAEARVPLLIESATLPTQLLDTLKEIIVDSGATPTTISFRYSRCCSSLPHTVDSSNSVVCHDKEYVDRCLKVRWVTDVISDEELALVVKDHVSRGDSVLIVRNTVEKAVSTYLKLKEAFNNIALIHGRFTKSDRAKKLSQCRRAEVAVATQVIEAGVNLNFDVLITDAASPSSIVQRAGRIARDCREGEAYVYVVKSDGDSVYDEVVTREFTRKLIDLTRDSKYVIEWRIPSEKLVDSRISFLKIMNEVYAGRRLVFDVERYSVLTEIITKPLITQDELSKVIYRYKSILYSSVLTPVYVGRELPSSMEELLSNSVPLSLNYIQKFASKLLRKYGCDLGVIALKCTNDFSECGIIEYKVRADILKDPVRLFMTRILDNNHVISPLAFIARSSAYSAEVGLRV